MTQSSSTRWINLLFLLMLVLTTVAFILFGGSSFTGLHWWISLASILLVEASGYVYVLHWARNRHSMEQHVSGSLVVGLIICCCGLVMLVNMVLFWILLNLSAFPYLIIQAATAIVTLAAIVIMILVKQYMQRQESDTASKVEMMMQLRLVLAAAKNEMEQVKDLQSGELKQKVIQLEELVKYSDPVGHPSLISLEQSMLWQATELEKLVRSIRNGQHTLDSNALVQRFIHDIQSDLHKRNTQLMTLK